MSHVWPNVDWSIEWPSAFMPTQFVCPFIVGGSSISLGGGANPSSGEHQHIILPNFPKKLHEIEKNLVCGGVCRECPLGFATASLPRFKFSKFQGENAKMIAAPASPTPTNVPSNVCSLWLFSIQPLPLSTTRDPNPPRQLSAISINNLYLPLLVNRFIMQSINHLCTRF